MVRALLPTPPAPTTTNLYSVILTAAESETERNQEGTRKFEFFYFFLLIIIGLIHLKQSIEQIKIDVQGNRTDREFIQ